jgi:hypothetical protein
MPYIGNMRLWPDYGVGHWRWWPWTLSSSISHLFNWTTGTRVMLVKVYFFGKGPGQGQISGLLGHGPQIPDQTIDHCKVTDLFSKFQLTRCYSGWEIGDRRTDRQTDGRHNDFSRTLFFKKCALIMCSNNVLSWQQIHMMRLLYMSVWLLELVSRMVTNSTRLAAIFFSVQWNFSSIEHDHALLKIWDLSQIGE